MLRDAGTGNLRISHATNLEAVAYTIGARTLSRFHGINRDQAKLRELHNQSESGIDPNLLSLDIFHYTQPDLKKPVVVYVHGGGWRIGDKTNKLDNKLSLFHGLGYVFISINYRLSPSPRDPVGTTPVRYPDHNNDVADAVRWVYDNIGGYGGDPSKIVLLGHSAGAHLVSLSGTSQQFLPARGLSLNRLKGIASIDTEGYDVFSQRGEEIYQNAFGTDSATLVQASPIYNLTASESYPGFFIAKRGTAQRLALADAFITRLREAGVTVALVDGSVYDHEGINDAIGNPTDGIVTPALKQFLQECFR